MSDTPRTDAEQFVEKSADNPFVEAAFARQLERELNETKEALKRGADTAARMLEVTIKERDEARGVVLACHRAFNSGSDFVRQEAKRLAAKMLDATIKERDKARECLREAIAYRDRTMSGYDLQEWLEALGEEKQ